MREIISRIFEYIGENGLTVQKFADIIGVTRGTVQNWKSGHSEPEHKRIIDIIQRIEDIDANYLIRGKPKDVLLNKMVGSYNTNQQGKNTFRVAEDNSENIWKLKYHHAMELIAEKEKQIDLLKNMLK